MPNLLVRDIPERVYERLRERAASNRRSMSSEIVTMLERAVLPQPVDVDALIGEAEDVHRLFAEPLPDLISKGKREGRRYAEDLSVVAEPGDASKGRPKSPRR
jgi:plasmid stability protein